MDIYNYHPVTHEFISISEADVNPLAPENLDPADHENFLFPAYSTTIKPPELDINENAIFNESKNQWVTVSDYRGTKVPNPYIEGDFKIITTLDITPDDIEFEEPEPLTAIQQRVQAYPAVTDQLDAIMKWIASGDLQTIPDELKNIAQRCMAVKEEFPKEE